jgi:hypothetical protein
MIMIYKDSLRLYEYSSARGAAKVHILKIFKDCFKTTWELDSDWGGSWDGHTLITSVSGPALFWYSYHGDVTNKSHQEYYRVLPSLKIIQISRWKYLELLGKYRQNLIEEVKAQIRAYDPSSGRYFRFPEWWGWSTYYTDIRLHERGFSARNVCLGMKLEYVEWADVWKHTN